MVISHWEMLLRVATGTALAGAIGFERDRHKRPVGLRTHMIVGLAAATFMVVSCQLAYFQHYAEGDHMDVDGSRIAASVVSGISFLAGGAIIRSGASIQGLTTGAGLWLVTAIGLCTGAGMFVEGVLVTLLGLLVLTVLRRFEDKRDDLVTKRVSMTLAEGSDATSAIMSAIRDLGVTIRDVEYDRRLDEKRRTELTFDLAIPSAISPGRIIETIERFEDVRRLKVEAAG